MSRTTRRLAGGWNPRTDKDHRRYADLLGADCSACQWHRGMWDRAGYRRKQRGWRGRG